MTGIYIWINNFKKRIIIWAFPIHRLHMISLKWLSFCVETPIFPKTFCSRLPTRVQFNSNRMLKETGKTVLIDSDARDLIVPRGKSVKKLRTLYWKKAKKHKIKRTPKDSSNPKNPKKFSKYPKKLLDKLKIPKIRTNPKKSMKSIKSEYIHKIYTKSWKSEKFKTNLKSPIKPNKHVDRPALENEIKERK